VAGEERHNVVLSEKLEKDDLVRTKGDVDERGQGFPPDLIVGKIISVNKQPSALFQSAEVKSLVDFSRLSTVFVITQN
jgi:rod shape-determining protein MreC